MENLQAISASFAEMWPAVLASIVCCAIWLGVCHRLRPGEAGSLLFMKSMMTLGTVGLFYLGAMFLGVTPANQDERDFVDMVRNSAVNRAPAISTALSVVDSGMYLSKSDFEIVAESFGAMQRLAEINKRAEVTQSSHMGSDGKVRYTLCEGGWCVTDRVPVRGPLAGPSSGGMPIVDIAALNTTTK
jgi:hypothetical protein